MPVLDFHYNKCHQLQRKQKDEQHSHVDTNTLFVHKKDVKKFLWRPEVAVELVAIEFLAAITVDDRNRRVHTVQGVAGNVRHDLHNYWGGAQGDEVAAEDKLWYSRETSKEHSSLKKCRF
jgi:hypothetical protein